MFPLLFLSCGIRAESMTRIGRRYLIEERREKACRIPVYLSKNDNNGLEGKVKFKEMNGDKVVAVFSNGVLNGSFQRFRKRFMKESSNYKNGLRNGTNQHWTISWNEELRKDIIYHFTGDFRNGKAEGVHRKLVGSIVLKKSTYRNGLKIGEEMYYNESGDTLDQIVYKFTEQVDVSPVLLRKIPEKYRSFPIHGKWTVSGRKPELYSKLVFLLEAKLIDEACMKSEVFLIEINNQMFASVYTPFGLSSVIFLQ